MAKGAMQTKRTSTGLGKRNRLNLQTSNMCFKKLRSARPWCIQNGPRKILIAALLNRCEDELSDKGQRSQSE